MTQIENIPLKLRYLIVGGMNTGISYLMYIAFIYFLGKEQYQTSLALSWLLSSFISFTLQKKVVFQSKDSWVLEYVRCLISWSIAYLINALLLEFSVKYLQLSPLFAQLIAVCSTTVITYFLFKHFAFRKGNING